MTFMKKEVNGRDHIVHSRDLGEESSWVDHVINGVLLNDSLVWEYMAARVQVEHEQAVKKYEDNHIVVNERNVDSNIMESESCGQHFDEKGGGKFFRKRTIPKTRKERKTKPKEKEIKKDDKVVQFNGDNKWRASKNVYEEAYDGDPYGSQPYVLECSRDHVDKYKGPGKIVKNGDEYHYFPPPRWCHPTKDYISIHSAIDTIEQGRVRGFKILPKDMIEEKAHVWIPDEELGIYFYDEEEVECT